LDLELAAAKEKFEKVRERKESKESEIKNRKE
jgi:hypothetical protein